MKKAAKRATDKIQADCILGGGSLSKFRRVSSVGMCPEVSTHATNHQILMRYMGFGLTKDLAIYVAAAQTQWCSGNTALWRGE